jgi:hypothetical protein
MAKVENSATDIVGAAARRQQLPDRERAVAGPFMSCEFAIVVRPASIVMTGSLNLPGTRIENWAYLEGGDRERWREEECAGTNASI